MPRDRMAERRDEHTRDLLTAARVMRVLTQADKDALAYQHASHGCDFEDSDVECPICDKDTSANETLAFFGGIQ